MKNFTKYLILLLTLTLGLIGSVKGQNFFCTSSGTTGQNFNAGAAWNNGSASCTCAGTAGLAWPTTSGHTTSICTAGKTITCASATQTCGNLTITSGTLTINSGCALTCQNIILNGGTLNVNGTLTINGTVTFTSGTINASSGTVVYAGAAQNVFATTYGTLTCSGTGAKTMLGNVTTSNLNLNTSLAPLIVGNNTLTATGTITQTSSGAITLSTTSPYSSLVFGSTAVTSLGGLITNTGTMINLNNLTVGAGNVNLGAKNFRTNGVLTVGTGDLTINGNTLEIFGTAVTANGSAIVGSTTSRLYITGSGACGTIWFGSVSTADQTFAEILINRSPSGTVTFASAHRTATNGAYNLYRGTVTNSSAWQLSSGTTFTRLWAGTVSQTPTMVSGTYNLVYGDGTDATSFTTGNEMIPAAINNLTVNVWNGTSTYGTLTLNTSISPTVAGIATFSGGYLSIASNTLTLNGTVTGMSANAAIRGAASGSNLTIGGSGTLGTLFFDQTTPGTTNNIATYTQNRTTTGIVNLGNDLNISTSFAFGSTGGLFQLGNANLTLGSSATFGTTNAPSVSRMVVTNGTGLCRKTFNAADPASFTFPVGEITGTTEYSPAVLDFSGLTGLPRTIGVRVTDGTHPNLNTGGTPADYTTRYWTFSDNGSTQTYTGTLQYSSTGDVVGTEANATGMGWNGSSWSPINNSTIDAFNDQIDFAASTTGLNGLDVMVRNPNPPANDAVCGAVAITPNAAGSTSCSSPTAGDAAGATQTYTYGSCDFSYTSTVRDVWYSFIATATTHTISVTPSASYDPIITAYTATNCSTAVTAISGACVDDNGVGVAEELQLTGLTVGTRYYYRVYHGASTIPATTTFTTCVFTPNTNNEFCNGSTVTAVTLTPGTTCVTTSGDAVYASQTYSYGSCDFSYSSPAVDMWYRFQATNTSHTISVTGNGTFDPVVTAYSAGTTSTCPVTPSAISGGCVDATTAGGTENLQLTGLTVNNWYYVRVYHGASTVPTNTTFTICVLSPPANDEVCGATVVTPGTAGVTTCGTSASGDITLASQTYAYGSCDFSYTSPVRDVWYRFTATATSHTISVTGNGTFDPVVQAYTATNCSTSVALISGACEDNTTAGGTETLKLSNLSVGAIYYYRVYHGSGTLPSNTTFSTCVLTAPANDVVCGAVSLTPGSSCVTTAGDITLASQTYAASVSCDPNSTSPLSDVWYRFVAAATSQTITVAASSGLNPVVQVYTATNCSTAVASLSGACDAGGSSGSTVTLPVSGLTIGTTYYVRVYGTYAFTPPSTGTFSICVVSPPVNDNCATATSLTQNASCSTTGGTTVGATGTLGLFSGDDDDVWYTFTATGTAATIQVSSTGIFDAVLNLRDNSACNGVNMVYHEFSGSTVGSNTETIRVSGLTSGQTYKVRVFSSATGSGQNTFDICVFNYSPSGNDNISGAITASVGNTVGNSNATYGLQVNTTASGVTGVEPSGSNWFPYPPSAVNSQWFTFTPTTTGCYRLAATGATATATFDSEIAIYTTTNVNNWNAFTEVASDEDGGPAGGFGTWTSMVNTTLNAGVTYYVQVSHFPYGSGTPTLRILNMTATVPVATAATATSCTGFTANWNAATNAASYQLDVATDAAFTSIVSGYNSLNVGNVTTYVVSGLPTGNNFYYRVRAVNACGTATANSNVITITNAPAQPGAFTASTVAVCGNQTGVVYTVPFVSGVTYNWSYSGTGATINGTGNSVTVDFASATPGTLSVTATACSITSAPQSIAISITPNVGTPSFTAGAATLCEGATSTYTATASNSTGITYSIFSGGATIDANTGAVSSVTSSFVVRATATGTCGANTTQDFAVTVNPLPATVVATAGTGATTTSIVANWGAAANATSYILEVSTVSNFASTVFSGNVGNVTSYSVGSLTASTTYYYRVTAVNACGNAAVSNTITYATTAPIGGFTWTGATSTDWNTASNWSGGVVPSANDDIIIPNQTNDPVLTTGANGVCKSVTINSGATVTINTGKTIDVKGNWTGANNTVSGAGDLIFSGTTAQTISGGATISNLQINNTSGVTVAAGGNLVNVTTALKLKAGQLTTNGNVKTISTVSNTAYIDDFSPTFAGTISGNVAVERYVTAGPNGYRYIGAPVATTVGGSTLALSALSGFVISGTPGQLIPLPTCSPNNSAMNSPYATFMRWEEAGPYLLNCRQSGWWFQTTGTMAIGRGYGAKLSGGNKITYTGAANTGNSPAYTCTSTNIFAPSLNGWNLVSNPFPSNIRIDNTDGNADNNMPAGFDGQVQFYQTSGPFTGTFVTFNAGTSSPPILPIALGQGFWVKVSNTGTANWSLSNDHRITTGATYYSTNVVEDHLNITVSGNGFMDQTDINFLPEATPGFDFYDASKWLSANGQPTLYTKIGEDLISINSNPSLENTVAIPMGLLPGADGEFTFNFNDIATFPQSAMIVLEDLQLGSLVDLRQTTTYTFTQLETDSADRFIIHFQPGITATVVDQDCDNATGSITFTQNGTTVWDTYNVKDNSNNTYAQGVNYTGTITVNNLPPQEYILNLTHSSGYSTQEFVTVNNNGTPITLSLAVADTTVLIGETVNFTATATGATNYAWDFGDSNTAQGGLTQQHTYAAVGEYLVTVTATNDSCSKAESKTVYVGTVGIDNTTASNLVIFGQGERVVVQFNNWGGNKADIFMYNTLGQRVESLTGVSTLKGRQEINVAGIKPGYYLIQVVSDGKIQSKKIYLGNY